jgi:hypothetical protein
MSRSSSRTPKPDGAAARLTPLRTGRTEPDPDRSKDGSRSPSSHSQKNANSELPSLSFPCVVSPDHSSCSAAAPPAQGTSPTPVPAAPKPARSTTPTAPPPTLIGYDYPDSDLQVVHNSLLRSIREANKQPAPRVDAVRQIQWELPSIPAAIASTAGESEAQDSSSALPPLPDHDNAGRAYLPPSALFGAMASSIVREWVGSSSCPGSAIAERFDLIGFPAGTPSHHWLLRTRKQRNHPLDT